MQLIKPIFILGCHKSGTSLVRSLFDRHPELDFVYPNELHFFRVSGYPHKYPLGTRFHRPSDFEDFARSALSLIEEDSRGKSPFAPFDVHSTLETFNPDTFLGRIRREPTPSTDRERLLRYFDAAAAAFGHDMSLHERPVRVVEKSVSNIEFAGTLKQFWPDCHFVHVIRDPHANVVAIRRARYRRRNLGRLRPFIQAIALSLEHALRNRTTIPDYHVVRYEDIIQNPEPTVRGLCSALGIRHAPSMLSPTVLGDAWGGNSTSRVSFSAGISKHPLSEWTNHITNIECALVNRHLHDLMASWGYPRVRPQRHWLLPGPGEHRSAYFANRLSFLPLARVRV